MDLIAGNTYTFTTLAPTKLSAKITNAYLLGTSTFAVASRLQNNVAQMYRQIYPSLPVGTPDAMTNVLWHQFKMEDGGEQFFCDQWIDHDSLVLCDYKKVIITFQSLSTSQVELLIRQIRATGITGFSTTIV